MIWALFRKSNAKGSTWEYCGMTPHDENVTEFEESNEEEFDTVVVPLEG